MSAPCIAPRKEECPNCVLQSKQPILAVDQARPLLECTRARIVGLAGLGMVSAILGLSAFYALRYLL